MAGDWIKMRADLFTHPKVVRMASALRADTLRTVGGLMSAWCLFDAHSVDGELVGYTSDTLDEHLRWPGFAAAMIWVGWLSDDGQALVLPEFDTHNGASAKRRAQDADRKKAVRKTSASDADKLRTREEKRREEKKEHIPKAAKAKETPMPADFALSERVKAWAAEKGHGNLEQRFEHFCGLARAKAYRYADWDEALMNAIRGDWAKLGTQTTGKPGGGRPKLA